MMDNMGSIDLSSDEHSLRDPERVASSSIRGYYYQFLHCVRCWLELEGDEVLWCEGNEDVDKLLSDQSRVEEQIKHLAGNVTEASASVRSSALGFLKGFVYQKEQAAKTSVRFVFRTTALLGKAQHPQLERWLKGGHQNDIKELVAGVRAAAVEAADIDAQEALQRLEDLGLEREFFESVRWAFGELNYSELRAHLRQAIAGDPRCERIDPDLLVAQVIERIAHASCANELAQRCLRRRDFLLLVNDTAIWSLCTHEQRNAAVETLYLAYGTTEKEVCAIVFRFADGPVAQACLSTAIEAAQNHPSQTTELNQSDIFDSRFIEDALLLLDCDIFGAWILLNGETIQTCTYQCVAFVAHLSKVRAGSTVLHCAEESLDPELQRSVPDLELQVVAPDVCSQLAQCLVRWALTRDSRLELMNARMRCFADLSAEAYFTQDEPLQVRLLSE